MKQRQKYLAWLSPSRQQQMLDVIDMLISGQWSSLDIQQLQGEKDTFRCRIWVLRIIFSVANSEVVIRYIWPRGDAYK